MTEHRRTARTKETYRKVSNSNPKVKQPPSTLEMASVRALKPDAGNARTHSKKQIKEIANSIARFGYINPVIVDYRSRIVAGHARAEAAKLLGLRQVPVIRLQHLSEVEICALSARRQQARAKSRVGPRTPLWGTCGIGNCAPEDRP